MGKRGPAPTPTAILRNRGSWRANANRREPKAPPGRPACPVRISEGAKKAWRSLVPILDGMGVLSKVDRNSLTRYCVTWDLWCKAVEFVNEHGTSHVVRAWNKHTQQMEVTGNKAFQQARDIPKYSTILAQLEQQFGLTPSARARIEVDPHGDEKEEEGKIKFFHGGARAGA